ncbi:MAG: nucleotide sugar dehydrogenase [Candidatus Omnitrophica bacterium]|nr:nucleotide sugar dehydrogenase [Candidatus Omnitrophota bacterium]
MSVVLKNKISKRTARVAVIGLGYVGLPLAVNFAKAGYRVTGLDMDQDRVNQVNACKSYISDIPTAQLAKVVRDKKFSASMDFALIGEMDVLIICVPTPLRRRYTPDISYILSAVRMIAKHFKKHALIVLESTTYPGTTEELILPELQKSGKKVGRDFYLSFSPERIDPGNKTYDVTRIPKVVGGVEPKSGEYTALLYKKIIKEIHVVSSAKSAEMTKLLENSFRIINVGWINEVAMMCHKMDINVWEVIEAAKTKPFGFMPFYPGLGVGGHCIPDDPLYLYWKAKHHGFSSKYIKLSADTNHHMPAYALNFLKDELKVRKKNLRKPRVLMVGVTYKKDIRDLRKSPPLTLIELMQADGFRVDYHDPIIPYLKIGKIDLESVPLTKKNLAAYDVVIAAMDHSKVNWNLILNNAKLIYDVKHIYGSKSRKNIIRF